MEQDEPKVSHVDLYHKLGKLEGLIETMMTSMSSFQSAMRDVHARIDAIEVRQTALERKRSSDYAAQNAILSLGKDFVIPVLIVIVTWLAAKNGINLDNEKPEKNDRTGDAQLILEGTKNERRYFS